MPERATRVQTIFLAAVELPPDERAALLDRECGEDTQLRDRVWALLKAHDDPGSFLEVHSSGAEVLPTVDQAPITERPGTTIGRYKLLEQIGEGGFGVVYMAEQTEPVHRKVAVKIIKPGMDTKEVIARFEAERQALALMDHPHIAKVLDAGATESQRPYFVMELVRGVPITDYCDQNHLSARQRLELFDSVCRAVQHAHQKGIIHRDIKPTNVLVTMRDDTAVPKVIDFGVAKATNQKLTERTLFTGYAQMLGTPLYMSPEQAQMNELDVDTRSDIYSLGVLLYELLTGTTPFDRRRLREAAYDDLLRIIREEEPHKPSTRISTLGESATRVSAHRQTDPKSLSRMLHGELDWIVMKALEKDRTRRYESANGLAADVRRYLADAAVSACPPSAAYRFRKFARRNKAVLGTLAMIGVVLVAASVFSTWQAIRAMRAEDAAQASLRNANLARSEADSQRERAEAARADSELQRQRAEAEAQAADHARERESAERERAEANFLKAREAVDRYFTMVSENTLLDRPDLDGLRQELLEGALQYYEDFAQQRADDPQLRTELVAARFRIAQLRNAMGRADWLESVQRGIGTAEQLAMDGVDVSHHSAWRAGIVTLSQNEQLSGEDTAVLPAFQKGAKVWETFVQRYPDVPGLQNDLATMYLVIGAAHDDPLASYASYKRAREILEGLVREYPATAGYRLRLAVLLHEFAFGLKSIGNLDRAKEEWRRSIDLLENLAAELPDAPVYRHSLAESMHTLAGALAKTDQHAEAEVLWARAIEIRQKLTTEFPDVPRYWERLSASYRFLGRHLTRVGRHKDAAEEFRGEIDALRKAIAEAPRTSSYRMQLFHAQRWLGFQHWELGRLDEANDAFHEALAIIEDRVAESPDDHNQRSWQARHFVDLARLLGDRGETGQAEELFDQSAAILEELVAEHPDVQRYASELEHTDIAISGNLIDRYKATTDGSDERSALIARIEKYVERCRKRINKRPENPTYYNALAWVVANTEGDLDEAILLSHKSIELARGSETWNSKGVASLLDTLAHCYFAKGDYAGALEYQEEAAALDTKSKSIRQALTRFRAALADGEGEIE